MSNENWEYESAWQQAWQERSCPPEDILFGEKNDELAAHLEFCPACRETREQDGKEEVELGKDFCRRLENISPPPTKEKISPGQIWAMKKDLGGWGEKTRYYTPPLIVIIEDLDQWAVRVAQIHEISKFAWYGDIPLGKDFEGYAESWNIYPVRKQDLSHCWGAIDELTLAKLRQSANNSHHEIRQGSLLYNFRQLEIETGYFFSSRAVASLMEKYEAADDVPEQGGGFQDFIRKPPTAATMAALAESRFIPPEKIVSLEDYLLRSRFTEERQAAASDEVFYFSGPAISCNEDEQIIITAIHGQYDPPDYDSKDHSLALEGFFDELPKDITEEQAVFGWMLPDGSLVPVTDFWFDLQDLHFNVIVADIPSKLDAEDGRLRFCLIQKGITGHVRD